MEKVKEFEIIFPEVVWYGDVFVELRKEIIRFDSFKAKVNSNEKTGHHRPHVHIEYKNINYVCTIDDIVEVIEPKNERTGICKYICSIVARNISKCRTEWNKISSNYKFSDDKICFKTCRFITEDNRILVKVNI